MVTWPGGINGRSISRLAPFPAQGIHEEFHCFLGAMHWPEAAVGPRQQQCAFELAKDRSGEQRGILPAEAFEPAREFVLPALEGVAGGSAKNFGDRKSTR